MYFIYNFPFLLAVFALPLFAIAAYLFFQVSALVNSWIVIDYLPVARAVFIVVVDDPASLQARVDRDRAEIFEAALFKLLADFV